MLNLNITIDISERLEAAINNLSTAIRDSALLLPQKAIDAHLADGEKQLRGAAYPKIRLCNSAAPSPSTAGAAPECVKTAGATNDVPAVDGDEVAPEFAKTVDASNDVPADNVDKKKPAKKKPAKKAETAPVAQPDTEAVNTTTASENVKIDSLAVNSEPEKKEADDPMAGMTVVEAMNALVSEIQSKGVDMADVNSRVRAKAGELGLTYSSAACLIKAIGYVETRKVALGEK